MKVWIEKHGQLTGPHGFRFDLFSADLTAVSVDGRGTLIPNAALTFENVFRALTYLRHGLKLPLLWDAA